MSFRTNSTVRYLEALDKSLHMGWLESYKLQKKSRFVQLALLHPLHFQELDLPGHQTVKKIQEAIQGPRSFPTPLGGHSCDSSLLWGYECGLNAEIQQDHLFPYSLGGPTLQTNRIFLCSYHNMVKSSDIHCYPWESIDQWTRPWLERQIDKLYKEVFNQYS